MKTKLALLLAFLVSHFFAAASAQEVVIPDAALETAIWQSLGRSGGILTVQDMLSLTILDASSQGVKSLEGLGAAQNLTTLNLDNNQLTSLTLPAGLSSLAGLNIEGNQLTNLTLPEDLTNLTFLALGDNQLRRLTLPAGLTNLTRLSIFRNPLQSIILPHTLAVGTLADTVAYLVTQGVSVSIYPLTLSLVGGAWTATGTFECLLTGPPGTYRIQVTPDFSTWADIGPVVNETGSVQVADPSVNSRTRGFYRAVRSN